MKKEKNPNFLHWAGVAIVAIGYYQLLCLLDMRGFLTMIAGAGVGLLGCEYERIKDLERLDFFV